MGRLARERVCRWSRVLSSQKGRRFVCVGRPNDGVLIMPLTVNMDEG